MALANLKGVAMNLIWVCNYQLNEKFPFPNTSTGLRFAQNLFKLMEIYHPAMCEVIIPPVYFPSVYGDNFFPWDNYYFINWGF